MFLGLKTTIYRVPNLASARAWFTDLLGVDPYFDEPFYVGFDVSGSELGLIPIEDDGGPETLTYWRVADIDAAVASMTAQGATVRELVTDVGGGIRVAMVVAPAGVSVGVIQMPDAPATAPDVVP